MGADATVTVPLVHLRRLQPRRGDGRRRRQIEALLEDGWRPEDLALLTTGSRHPEQAERQKDGHQAYWDTFWDTDQVFYGHVLGFKGLERRAVVLVVNEASQFERSRERLYVGLSRARDQLVVCGDPDFLREVGGPDLARRLNVPPIRSS